MNLEMLRHFVSVVEAGSFTQAALNTGIPKSTLSRKLQEFEVELDMRLMERSTRSLRLTADGQLLYERARHLISAAVDIEHELKDRDKTPKGRFRVAVPSLFGQLFIGRIAGQYGSLWPDVQLEIVVTDRPVDLIEDDFDCAIKVGELQDSSLVAQTFANTYHVAVASPTIEITVAHPNDLNTERLIVFQTGVQSIPWLFESATEQVEVVPKPACRIGNLYAVREACKAGGGIAWLPEFLVHKDMEKGRLVRVLPDWKGPDVSLRLVYPSR